MASIVRSIGSLFSPSKPKDVPKDDASEGTKKYKKNKKGMSQDVPASVLETSSDDPISQLTQDSDDEDDNMPITQADETSSKKSGGSKKSSKVRVQKRRGGMMMRTTMW
jgi:hypothetical protein